MRQDKEVCGHGYCEVCEAWVDVVWHDGGFGPYEYWGAPGYHHDWRAVCEYCGEEVGEYDEEEWEMMR